VRWLWLSQPQAGSAYSRYEAAPGQCVIPIARDDATKDMH
jgi:hypothetical protein